MPGFFVDTDYPLYYNHFILTPENAMNGKVGMIPPQRGVPEG